MLRKKALALIAASAVGLSGNLTFGQESLLSELYGLGVHSYFAQDYQDAYDNLSAAAEAGSRDPRVYYFRGLAAEQIGKGDEAKADYEKGAQLEAKSTDMYAVGRALERVQGAERLKIERTRQIVRIKVRQDELARSKARYEETRTVQEPLMTQGPAKGVPQDVVEVMTNPAAAASDPFAGEEGALGAGSAEAAPDRAAGPAAGGGDDPFGGPAAPAASEPDPFGGAPAEEPAAGGAADPFGGDAPAEQPAAGGAADPFGGDAPAAEEPAAGGAADPFGGAPAEEPAAGGAADPFGGDAPAEQPAAGGAADPFGGDAAEMPAEEPAGEAPPAGGAADPFGAAPAGGAPAAGGGVVGGIARGIGDAINEVKNDTRDPFDEADEPKADGAPAAGGADPFGGAAPAGEAPAGDMKKDDAVEDPFADDPGAEAAPAAEPAPAADDPFG